MISVVPASFAKVEFEVEQIHSVASDVQATLAASAPALLDVDVALEIDEEQPTTRMGITSLDPVIFSLDSGALEDTRKPREFGVEMASVSLASLFLELLDRTDADFGAPGIGEPTDLAEKIAWSANLHGRVQRAGYRVHKPKHVYNFRNRHGFSDAADQAFEALWNADRLTYAEILELCPPRP